MAAPSQKQLKTKILDLAKRKQNIDQPGRLVAHIINELKLTSHSTIREPIIMALESLEEEKLITIGRNGTVMSTMVYIEPKPKSVTRTPALKTPTRQRATAAAAKQPADRLPSARTRRPKAEETAMHQPPIVNDEPEAEAPDDKSLFVRLVEKAESLKNDLAASQQQTADANAALSAKEQELADAVAAKAQADTDMAALARELEAARGALEESSGMNELLTEENRRVGEANRGLQEQVDAYQHLEARALSVLND